MRGISRSRQKRRRRENQGECEREWWEKEERELNMALSGLVHHEPGG